MGAPAPNQVYDKVYYDTEQGQYYTVKAPENSSNAMMYNFNPMAGMYAYQNPSYLSNPENRNYLGNPYQQMQQKSAVPEYNYIPYDQLTNVLPELNTNVNTSSLLDATNNQMSGANRFVNTQGK